MQSTSRRFDADSGHFSWSSGIAADPSRAGDRPHAIPGSDVSRAPIPITPAPFDRQASNGAIQSKALTDAFERVASLTTTNPKSGLPNRPVFVRRLDAHLRERAHHRTPTVLVLVEITNLDEIVTEYGHVAGIMTVVRAANALQSHAPSATIGHLTANGLGMVLSGIEPTARIEACVASILDLVRRPFRSSSRLITPTATAIAARASGSSYSAQSLLRDAFERLDRHRDDGATVHVLSAGTARLEAARHYIIDELRRALEEKQFILHYQPIIESGAGAIAGFEALARWRHAHLGVVNPDEFVPLLEETGLIVPFGRWALEQACRDASAWQRPGLEWPIFVAVNLSARQIESGTLVRDVREAIESSGLPPMSLALELTERVSLEDPAAAAVPLGELSRMGIQIALDDFGTVESPLSYLRHIRFDAIKLESMLVSGSVRSDVDTAIITEVADLAHRLGLWVVAEGIEDRRELDHVRSLGCDLVQGYHLGHPATLEQTRATVARFLPRHA